MIMVRIDCENPQLRSEVFVSGISLLSTLDMDIIFYDIWLCWVVLSNHSVHKFRFFSEFLRFLPAKNKQTNKQTKNPTQQNLPYCNIHSWVGKHKQNVRVEWVQCQEQRVTWWNCWEIGKTRTENTTKWNERLYAWFLNWFRSKAN